MGSALRLSPRASGCGAVEFGEVAGERWLALLPKKWNRQVLYAYGWRYDPREFAGAPAERELRDGGPG